jgi:photoactive yellow protein
MEKVASVDWFDVSARDLYKELGSLRVNQFDQLPFGAIRLTRKGIVLEYNAAEAAFARRDPLNVVGKNFFAEVAPCARVGKFYDTFLQATRGGEFDHTFKFTFRFPFGLRQVRIRLFSDGTANGIYAFVDPSKDIALVGAA